MITWVYLRFYLAIITYASCHLFFCFSLLRWRGFLLIPSLPPTLSLPLSFSLSVAPSFFFLFYFTLPVMLLRNSYFPVFLPILNESHLFSHFHFFFSLLETENYINEEVLTAHCFIMWPGSKQKCLNINCSNGLLGVIGSKRTKWNGNNGFFFVSKSTKSSVCIFVF